MTEIIYRTNQLDWAEAGMAKKQLAWHRANNKKGLFDAAIQKEEDLIRSFLTAA